MPVTALIPAYNPSASLAALVRELAASSFEAIVVVNDGSATACRSLFDEVADIDKVTVLHHAVNLGKGAALKTGLNYIYCHRPDSRGVVTLDADGQHLVTDALAVAQTLREHPEALIVGVRVFDRDVPLRSKFGNLLTRQLFRFLVGHRLTDTQSGLRGIPREFIPALLRINACGYEFELDMLLACKYRNMPMIEREISTVYVDGNRSSHFNPLLDSMRIYFVLFRFTFASLLSAVIDYTLFILVFSLSNTLVGSQVAARLVSMLFNYTAVKRVVFYSDQQHTRTFPKYLTLVVASGSVSLLLIDLMIRYTPLNVISAKVVAESLVFLANFAIQRDFIFTRRSSDALAAQPE
jgi:glycosyltransferase involved in cell wall biosynthesis